MNGIVFAAAQATLGCFPSRPSAGALASRHLWKRPMLCLSPRRGSTLSSSTSLIRLPPLGTITAVAAAASFISLASPSQFFAPRGWRCGCACHGFSARVGWWRILSIGALGRISFSCRFSSQSHRHRTTWRGSMPGSLSHTDRKPPINRWYSERKKSSSRIANHAWRWTSLSRKSFLTLVREGEQRVRPSSIPTASRVLCGTQNQRYQQNQRKALRPN